MVHSVNNSNSNSQAKFYETSEVVQYQGKSCTLITKHTKVSFITRLAFLIYNLALTFFTAGVALCFSSVRERWKIVFAGIKKESRYEEIKPLYVPLSTPEPELTKALDPLPPNPIIPGQLVKTETVEIEKTESLQPVPAKPIVETPQTPVKQRKEIPSTPSTSTDFSVNMELTPLKTPRITQFTPITPSRHMKSVGLSFQTALDIVLENPITYFSLPKKFQEDERIAEAFLSKDILGSAIMVLDKTLLNNEDFLIRMIVKNPHCLFWLNERKSDEPFIRRLLEKIGVAIVHVDSVLEEKIEIAIIAVKQNGLVLEMLPHFQNERIVVIEAITCNRAAYKFASNELKADPTIKAIAGIK